MEISEDTKDRIELVIETTHPGKFVGQPHLLDRLKQTITQITEIEDVRVQVLQVERADVSA